jgi:hypothetical protein
MGRASKGVFCYILAIGTVRGVWLVLVWGVIEANRHKNLVIFLEILVTIDLHEGSRFIEEGIFTNSISLAQSRLRIYI